ncbi:photosystem II S4 domain protein [Selenomonas sp. TAMA-11512]|uniref:YlmH family RNA-binding protein n=1 Tax=Selenomonas sp. TAMA-11512 TaxID=3095337 RepID=UPI00309061A8|nr:photosystem II S4 domain protein [Selenomonas sp. TAMA-11512]
MSNRDKILRYYRGTEGEEVAVRLIEAAEQTSQSGKFRRTEFLDPYGQEIAEVIAANYSELTVSFEGGYPGAERQRAIFRDRTFEVEPPWEINVVKASWGGGFYHLTHRDILGALMGLGIDRAVLGDFSIREGEVKIICDEKVSEFLLREVICIGSVKVTCTTDTLDSIPPKEERVKEIKATVASLRVDSIAAVGFGMSRSRAASDIEADKLKLNWQSVKSNSQTVKVGDVLSMRGRGRLEVAAITGMTKKGRTGVCLKRYM